MPSTYSTNLKLELMATGENNSTWGTKTNNNLGTLLEQSIVGQTTLAMADADQTLVMTDGSSSDGRYLYIKCTGVTTQTRTVFVPDGIQKNYIVENATSSGNVLRVRTVSGSTWHIVRSGAIIYLYSDGVEVGAAFNAVGSLLVTQTPTGSQVFTLANAKTFTVSNTLTLAGTDGTTFTFPSTSGAVATTSAAQTFTGKTLTDCDANTQSPSNNSTKIATTAYVDLAIPTGAIIPYGGSTAPTGWLLCHGQTLNRTGTYANLFAVISTTFGAPSGSTFSAPDLRGRAVAGKDNMGGSAASRLTSTTMSPDGVTVGAVGGTQTHTLVTGEIPAHSHGVTDAGHTHALGVGNLGLGGTGSGDVIQDAGSQNSASATTGITIDNTGGGGAHLNVQPTMVLNYIIKY